MHPCITVSSIVTLQTEINGFGDYGILNGFCGKVEVHVYEKNEEVQDTSDMKYNSWIIIPALSKKTDNLFQDLSMFDFLLIFIKNLYLLIFYFYFEQEGLRIK